LTEKQEILFYYESRQNPNGDPGFDNQPRMMPDGTIMVTDVRIKRTMRDYAKNVLNKTLFVDYGKDGQPAKADKKAEELLGSLKGDVMAGLLEKTFDVPLFGALVPIRNFKQGEGSSEKLTGSLQFGIGRSVNQVQIINPLISGRFQGKEGKQFSTFGKFYSVEYALIKIHGALNSQNLDKYLDDKNIMKKFEECTSKIFECLWNGTNELVTRSKFPQRSILFIEITYKDTIFNDLPNLVQEREDLKGKAKSLGTSPFNFEKLLSAIDHRKNKIVRIGIKGAEELDDDLRKVISEIKSKNVEIEEIAA
jgi:CRISPR-associated protein Csh2